MNKEKEFEKLIKIFGNELYEVCNYFKINRTINQNITQSELNKFPQFWGITLNSLKGSFFISFARIFEKRNYQSESLNIFSILDFCNKNIEIFSRQSLQARKSKFPNYANNADELTLKDIKTIQERLSTFSNKIGKIRHVRNKTVAHKDMKELFKPTIKSNNIGAKYGEIWEIICFSKRVQIFLWELYHNGIRLDLTNEEEFKKEFNMNEFKFFDEFDKQTSRFFINYLPEN